MELGAVEAGLRRDLAPTAPRRMLTLASVVANPERRPLRGQWHRSGLVQRDRQPGQDGQVGVQRDALKPTHP
jgi:hypothetical protein